jgi:hypothetical protein
MEYAIFKGICLGVLILLGAVVYVKVLARMIFG